MAASVELGPLPRETLADYPGAWESTRGLPSFVAAFLGAQPLGPVLEGALRDLDEAARRVFLALALLDEPNLPLVRTALDLDAATMGGAMETLLKRDLIDPDGEVRVRQAARDYLEERPAESSELMLGLANRLPPLEAFPLYQRTRALWSPEDAPSATQAYVSWAEELLKRGFPGRATEVLTELPASADTALVRARALERSGRYQDALDTLETLGAKAEVGALRAAVLFRLGRPDEAREEARTALGGDMEARAEGLNVMGHLEGSVGKHEEARKFYRRSATLWQALGDRGRRIAALGNAGISEAWLGRDAEAAFVEAFEAAGENGQLLARLHNNLGLVMDRRGDREAAFQRYREAARIAAEAGATSSAARAWYNLGTLHHRNGEPEEARAAYERGLENAQRARETVMIAANLASLAELDDDPAGHEEALRLMEESGNVHLARYFREFPDS